MIRGKVQWVPGEERLHQFVGTSGSGHAVVFDDLDGGMGPTPLETVALALAGCTAFDVITILRKKKQEVVRYEVRVEADQQLGPPAVFAALRVHHVVQGRGVSPDAVRQAVDLSHRKYCTVGAMLGKTAPVRATFEVVDLCPPAPVPQDEPGPLPQS
jgi:putative redox protein